MRIRMLILVWDNIVIARQRTLALSALWNERVRRRLKLPPGTKLTVVNVPLPNLVAG